MTDTDSVVLSSPLPEEKVSSTVLGKFKLEHILEKGLFLAAKSYYLLPKEGKVIIKHKGLAKALVNEEWFESQYADLSRTQQTTVESNFKIDWERLNITKKETLVSLGIRIGNKREPVHDNEHWWVDTAPLNVTNYAGRENRIRTYEMKCLREESDRKDKRINDLESQLAIMTSETKLNSINNTYQDKKSQSHSAHKADDPKKQPPKGKNKKKKPG